jgi:chromatin remodeling complex protein RSC6
MATEIETGNVLAEASKDTVSLSDQLKNTLQILLEQAGMIKTLMVTVRGAIKDSDKQSKELEKLRNKRSRNKTERAANSQPSGITKPVAISDELAKFLGVAPGTLVPRNEVTKGVSEYVKANGLSDPTNKQKFVLDDRTEAKALKVLLGNPTEDVTYFNLQRYLKHHYIPMAGSETPKTPKPKKESKKEAVPATPAPEPAAAPAEAPAKKKILVKKKKAELTEEA